MSIYVYVNICSNVMERCTSSITSFGPCRPGGPETPEYPLSPFAPSGPDSPRKPGRPGSPVKPVERQLNYESDRST